MKQEIPVGHFIDLCLSLPPDCRVKPGQKVHWRIESRDCVECQPGRGSTLAVTRHGLLVFGIRFRPMTAGDFCIKLNVGYHRLRVPASYRAVWFSDPEQITLLGASNPPPTFAPHTLIDDPHGDFAQQDREPIAVFYDFEPPQSRFAQSNIGYFVLFAFAVLTAVVGYFFLTGRL